MRAGRVERHFATLMGGLLLAVSAHARAGAGDGSSAVGALSRGPEAQLVDILRRARVQEGSDYALLVDQAAAVGPEGIWPSLRIIESERVPPLQPDQTPQVLSRPQREILLSALARLDGEDVLSALAARLALGSDLRGRLLGLRVLGAVGDATVLENLASLALTKDEEEPPPGLEPALQEAIARILQREPKAFDRLPRLLRASPDPLQGVWIAAAGDSGNWRTLELCSYAFRYRSDLAPVAAAQVLRVGRAPRAEVNRDLIQALRGRLDPEKPGLCRSVLLALGELRDYDSIPALIALLDSSDKGLAQNATWALQRITGLTFPDVAERWRQWHAEELAWFQHEEQRIVRDLGSRDAAKVSEALREIGRRRTQRESLAVEVLAVLERGEPSLRAQACDTLGLLGSETALPALIDRLEADIPYCSQAAWRALVAISGLDLPAEAPAWRDALGPGA